MSLVRMLPPTGIVTECSTPPSAYTAMSVVPPPLSSSTTPPGFIGRGLDGVDGRLEVVHDPLAHPGRGRFPDPDDLQPVGTGRGDDGTRLRGAGVQAGDGLAPSHYVLAFTCTTLYCGSARD